MATLYAGLHLTGRALPPWLVAGLLEVLRENAGVAALTIEDTVLPMPFQRSKEMGFRLEVDPLLYRASDVNIYRFVANEPVRGLDPQGWDVVYLNNPEAAHGKGHAAIIVGNDTTGWKYYSYGEGTGSSGGGSSGGSSSALGCADFVRAKSGLASGLPARPDPCSFDSAFFQRLRAVPCRIGVSGVVKPVGAAAACSFSSRTSTLSSVSEAAW